MSTRTSIVPRSFVLFHISYIDSCKYYFKLISSHEKRKMRTAETVNAETYRARLYIVIPLLNLSLDHVVFD